MKKILVVCLCVAVSTILLPRVSAGVNRSTVNPHVVRTSAFGQDTILPAPQGNSQIYDFAGRKIMTEVRKGVGVALRADQLRKKDRGFAKAYRDLIKRGHKLMFEEAGVTMLGMDTATPAIKKIGFTGTQDIVDGDYELSFFPVDNGNPATWEGLIYAKTPAGAGTYAVAHDTTQADLSQTEVYYEDYYPSGGGHGPDVDGRLREQGYGSVVPVAFGAATAGTSSNASGGHGNFKLYLGCVALTIGILAEWCVFAGPLFWGCIVVVAIAALLVCLPLL